MTCFDVYIVDNNREHFFIRKSCITLEVNTRLVLSNLQDYGGTKLRLTICGGLDAKEPLNFHFCHVTMEGLNRETKSCKGQLLPINGILNYLTVLSLDILNFSLKLSGIHRLDVKINALFSFTTPNEASVSMPWKLSSILSL